MIFELLCINSCFVIDISLIDIIIIITPIKLNAKQSRSKKLRREFISLVCTLIAHGLSGISNSRHFRERKGVKRDPAEFHYTNPTKAREDLSLSLSCKIWEIIYIRTCETHLARSREKTSPLDLKLRASSLLCATIIREQDWAGHRCRNTEKVSQSALFNNSACNSASPSLSLSVSPSRDSAWRVHLSFARLRTFTCLNNHEKKHIAYPVRILRTILEPNIIYALLRASQNASI